MSTDETAITKPRSVPVLGHSNVVVREASENCERAFVECCCARGRAHSGAAQWQTENSHTGFAVGCYEESIPPAAIHVRRGKIAPDGRRELNAGKFAEHQLPKAKRGGIVARVTVGEPHELSAGRERACRPACEARC